jgi:hypothetical protein
MKHITTEYGQPCNDLELTSEELKVLEPFLLALGVRCRTTIYWTENGTGMHKIQAENVYKACIGAKERKFADKFMTEDYINCYKR